MKNKLAVFIAASFILASCSSYIPEEKNDNNNQNQQQAQITINQSQVLAEVQSIDIKEDDTFTVKAKILDVEVNPAYESLAVVGNSYLLQPSFIIINKKVDENSERNKRLKSLTKLKIGDNFKAIIFSEGVKGWFVKDIIK